jgi:hypothetical protein
MYIIKINKSLTQLICENHIRQNRKGPNCVYQTSTWPVSYEAMVSDDMVLSDFD